MDWSGITAIFKAGTRVWVGIFVALSVVLFAPASLVQRLGLRELAELYRPWLGATWLLMGTLLLASMFAAASPTVTRELKWHLVQKRRGHKRLRNLTPDEKRILAAYLLSYSRSGYASIQDGVVQELEANRIIRRASSLSTYHTNFAYNLQPWAWEYLLAHPECVDLTADLVAEARTAANLRIEE